MKRNLTLSLILAVIATFTYYYEELGSAKKRELDETKHRIIDELTLGSLQEIIGPNFIIKKKENVFISENGQQIDEFRLQKFLEVLSSLKIRRSLDSSEYKEAERELYFPEKKALLKFKFIKGEVSFLLGKKLDFDQSFYMEIKRIENGKYTVEQIIAFDSSPNLGTYMKESFHKNDEKYTRFKTMILLDKSFFADTHIFYDEFINKATDWESIVVKNVRGHSYKILLKEKLTEPPVPVDLKTMPVEFDKFVDQLISIKGILWMDQGILGDEIASLEIAKADGKKLVVKIFKKYNGKLGFFAKISTKNKILSLHAKSMEPFFKKKHNFWDLTIFDIQKVKKIEIELRDVPAITVRLNYGKVFTATSEASNSGEAINTAFKNLTSLLGAGAQRFTSFEVKQDSSDGNFRLKWSEEDGQNTKEFNVKIEKDELILSNKKLGYKLYYTLGNGAKLGSTIEDYFIKK